jgi:hypothetical protein
MHTSSTPRLRTSVSTPAQYLAPSPPCRPQAHDVAYLLDGDADHHVDGPVGDLAVAEDHVHEQHRVHAVQRPVLPVGYLGQDRVGDPPDRVLGDTGPVHVGDVRRDLPVGETLGRQRQHQRLDPLQAALALADNHRLEAGITVPGHLDVDRADLGDHRLGPLPVAGVAPVAALRRVTVVAEVIGHLHLERGLQHLLREVPQQPARADQAQPFRAGLLHQPASQVLAHHRLHRRLHTGTVNFDGLRRRVNRIGHSLSFRAGPRLGSARQAKPLPPWMRQSPGLRRRGTNRAC